MKREEVRKKIREFLNNNHISALSKGVADDLVVFLKEQYPDRQFGNVYDIKAKYDSSFSQISGHIKRCDSFDRNDVIDAVSYKIMENLDINVSSDREKLLLTLDMNNLTRDDIVDIKMFSLPFSGNNDVYKTFMRVAPKERGKLASMVNGCPQVFSTDIPPYAFYEYEGLFYCTTQERVSFGIVKMPGSVAELNTGLVSIGEHAFDGCKQLKKVLLSGDIHYVGKFAFANIPGLIIECSASSKPDYWDDEWCDSNCIVKWN